VGYWQLLGTNQSVLGLVNSGGGGVIENTENHAGFGASTITLTGSGTYSFNGIMRNTASGSGTIALVMNGTGTQTLSGAGINYTGPTTVNAGVLDLRNTTAYTSATMVNGGATLMVSNTALQAMNVAITLNNGATLTHSGLTNGSDHWTNSQAVTVGAGANVTINQASVANTTGTNKGMFLDGGLRGGGAGAIVTINATNAGNGVSFRNNNTNFAGTLIVNGIASTTVNAGSGIGVGGCTTCLTNADITLNGTMELLNQGLGWANTASGAFSMGALNGTGVMVGNFTGSGSTAVTLGNTNNNGSFSGVIANGTGNTVRLIKTGAGTQTFTGTNTYTGGTTISAGTLQLGDGGTSGSIVGNITNNSVLAINRSDIFTYSGVISGTGQMQQAGTGTTILTGANTYTGGTTISAGTLSIGDGGTTGSIAGNIINNSALIFNRSNAVTYNGVLSGTGSLTQAGSGTLTLSGANTYTGGTLIDNGVLSISSDANLGGAAGGLTFDGGTLQNTASLVSSRAVNLLGAGTLAINSGTNLTLSGVMSGAGGLTVAGVGNGNLILTGANTFTGGINVTGGWLTPTSNGALGDASNGVTMANGTLLNATGNLASSRVITLTSGTVTLDGAGAGPARFTGAGGLVVRSGITLRNDASDYTGQTQFNGTGSNPSYSFTSIADLGVASALGAPTTVANGAILVTGQFASPTLSHTGTVARSSNRNWELRNASNGGTVTLRNFGSGALTLTGDILMSGPGINGATFTATSGNMSLLGVISSGGVAKAVTYTGGSTRTITLGGANTYDGTSTITAVTVVAPVLADYGLVSSLGTPVTQQGLVNVTGNGVLSYTGAGASTNRPIQFNNGTLRNDGSGALMLTPGSGFLSVTNTSTFGGSYTGANTVSRVISGTGTLAINTAGAWVLTAANTYAGATTITAGTLQIGNGGASGTLGAGAVTVNGTLAFNRSDSVTIANAIAGGAGGAVTQAGAGTTILTGANTYAGTTTISAGVLQIGDGGTTGALGTGAVTNNAALVLNRSDLLTVAGAIGGTGSLTQLGAGTSVLTGVNTYSGPTTISAGTLQIGDGGTTGTLGAGAVTNNAALVFNRSDALVVAGQITGAGTLTQQGSGMTTLTAAGSSASATTITAGTLDVTGGLETPTIAMTGASTLTVNGAVQAAGATQTAITGDAGANTVNIGAGGTLLANGDLGDGADLLDVAGTLDTGAGSFDLGLGDDTLTIHDGTTILGTVVGGAGIDTFNTNIALVADLGAVQGFEALSKTGAGVLNVNGPASSDFTTVDVLAGTLNVAAAGSINNVSSATVASGATLNLNGGFGFTAGADTFTVAGVVTGLADIDMLDGDDTFTIQDGADLSGLATAVDGGLGADTLLADIAGTATLGGAVGFETLIKSNLGTFAINGPATSMFNTVLVQGGTLTVGAGAIVDPQSTVVSSGATLTVNGTYNGTLGADTFDVSGIVNGAGTIDLLDGDDVLTLNDGADLSGLANPLDGGAHGAGDSVVLNNAAALTFGGGSIVNFESLQKTNTGAATLTGAHVYSLGTAVTGGVLDVDGGLETSTLAMSDGATVNVDGTVQAAGATQAAITGSAGVNTVTVGAGGTLLATGDLGDGADLLNVAGTLDTGPGSFDLGLGDDTLTLHDGTTILGTVVGGAGIDTFNTNIALAADLGAVQGFETLSKTGAGVLNVNGPASSDFTTVDVLVGTLNVAAAGSITGVNSATVASGATLNVDGGLGFTAGADTFTVAGAVTGTGAVDLLDGDDVLTLNDGANLSGLANPLDGGAHGAGDSVVLNNAAALTFGGGSIVNFEQLTKQNTGTATLTGAHSYAAGVTISAGVLQLGDGGTTGSVVGDVLNNGVLAFNRSDNVIFAGTISGAGALSHLGAGATTLTADNTYTGGTTIVAGTLQIGNGGTSGGIVGDVVNGATLAFNRSDAVTFGGVVSGTGSLNQIGAGTTILTGANTYTGGTTIAAGVLQLGDGGATGGVVGDVVNNGTLAFNRSDPIIFAGLISGTGGVSQIGTGATILTGSNSYAGPTSVAAGTLLINGDQSAAAGATTVALGATLGGVGAIGGDVFLADGATLAPGDASGPGTLTINGDLALAGATLLDYEFGQSNVVGGPLNDLVNIGGDLTLDGTIDVTVSAGGSFDVGVYRVIGYGGALTDNGLGVGAVPPGASVVVQTSVANQVNLVNAGGLTLNFWDGAAGPKFNNAVNGGDGVWQAGAGNDNWTDASGAVNASFSDAAFAIFSAAPGTVTIDNGPGAVTASGLQFASNGYVITGGDLTLVGPQSVIRVGDGTVTGLGFTATIASALSGTAQMVKTDLGTLVLSGTNTYTGGTLIDAGMLRISSDANLGAAGGGLGFDGGTLNTTADLTSARTVGLTGAGAILTDTGTTLTLAGAISGAGTFTKDGAGTLVLTGTNSYAGATTVNAGALFVNGDQSAATGHTSIASSATLGGAGVIGGDVALADGAVLTPGANGVGTLAINGALSLSSGTTLDYQFGQANAAGGGLNDLVNVGGDLVLDGTINVSVPTGGSFGGGVYRVFNYAGALTDNGLTLGALPASSVAVQTAIAGQFNLVNTAGLSLNFWDGAVGPKNNNAINGGDGVWRVGGGDNNWTELTGTVNADYAQDSFAVFAGAPGTVSVDDVGGAVRASSLQFAMDGYVLNGDALTLTGPQTTVRVGDGTAAGTGYTATIATELTGAAALVKTDAGTLVLTGANTYTGGTAIEGGTLRVASDANLGAAAGSLSFNGGTLNTTSSFSSGRAVNLIGAGTLLTDAGVTLSLSGAISGAGGLTKTGAGTLVLSGAGGYAGPTVVGAGALLVNGDFSAATGATSVASGATLGGGGTIGGDVTLADDAILTPGAGAPGTLTIAGDLALSTGSRLAFELGQANIAGGALNDLVNVGGDLVLDGAVDVSVPAGGGFGAGVYRVISYAGALTNNGLSVGALPTGAEAFVQTSVANQVNLVNTAGLTLNFWDGAAGPKNNGVINGGAGVWQAGGGNDNWTEAAGAVNAPYSDGAFAIFGGTGGAVTVDNSLGSVTAAGLQFAANGYTITGGGVLLSGAQSTVRVGRRHDGRRRLHRDDRLGARRLGPTGQDRRRHARARGRQHLCRRHADQRRHAADLQRRQSRRRDGRSHPRRRRVGDQRQPGHRARRLGGQRRRDLDGQRYDLDTQRRAVRRRRPDQGRRGRAAPDQRQRRLCGASSR
jgi:fibronectin-binding autotransporter adhesin